MTWTLIVYGHLSPIYERTKQMTDQINQLEERDYQPWDHYFVGVLKAMTETTELVEDSTKTMETGQVLLLIGIKVVVTIRVLETVPWS